MPWLCGICGDGSGTLKQCMKHIKRAHFETEPTFTLVCGIEGCPATYTIYESWYRHVSIKHGEYYYEGKLMKQKVRIGEKTKDTVDVHSEGEELVTETDIITEKELREKDDDELLSSAQDTRDIENVTDAELENLAAQEAEGDILAQLNEEAEQQVDESTHHGRLELLDRKASIYILGVKAKHSLTQASVKHIIFSFHKLVMPILIFKHNHFQIKSQY